MMVSECNQLSTSRVKDDCQRFDAVLYLLTASKKDYRLRCADLRKGSISDEVSAAGETD